MKSAYEKALERLQAESGQQKKLSDDEKARIAEIDKQYEARIAETKMTFQARIASAAPPEKPAIQAELSEEIQRLERRRDEEKDSIWNS